MARFKQHQGSLALAAVAWHELWYGCLRLPPSARRLTKEIIFLNIFDISRYTNGGSLSALLPPKSIDW
jgi:hypothetical protein